MTEDEMVEWHHGLNRHAATAAAKSLQSCPTLFNPMNFSPPGFPVLHYLPEFAKTQRRRWDHSNTLAWKIPWMEEPGRLQSMGS